MKPAVKVSLKSRKRKSNKASSNVTIINNASGIKDCGTEGSNIQVPNPEIYYPNANLEVTYPDANSDVIMKEYNLMRSLLAIFRSYPIVVSGKAIIGEDQLISLISTVCNLDSDDIEINIQDYDIKCGWCSADIPVIKTIESIKIWIGDNQFNFQTKYDSEYNLIINEGISLTNCI